MERGTDQITIIRVAHERMVYEKLEETAREWAGYLQQGSKWFVIDMSAVAFMDSASIGCLMDFYKKTRAIGGRIHLACVQPRIDKMLSIVKAKDLFGIYATVAEAVAALRSA